MFAHHLVLFLIAVSCVAASGESLERLEAIAQSAGSLDAFLSRPELREAYWQAAQAYFGERLTRQAFHHILYYVQRLEPSQRAQLWSTTGLGEAYTIRNEARSHGRRFDAEAWGRYFAPRLVPPPSAREETRLREEVAKLSSEISNIQSLDRRARAETYRKLREPTSPLMQLIDRLVHHAIHIHPDMQTGDPDKMLNTLHAMKENPAHYFKAIIGESDFLTGLVKSAIPLETMINERNIFPPDPSRPTSREGNFDFRPIPRRFHGIWKGLPLNECVACDRERWGSILIRNGQLHYVEQNGRYLGFMHLVPHRINLFGRVATVDYGAPVMSQTITFEGRRRPLHEAWLIEASRHLPQGWRGLAVGNSHVVNNAKVRELIDSSPAYLHGRTRFQWWPNGEYVYEGSKNGGRIIVLNPQALAADWVPPPSLRTRINHCADAFEKMDELTTAAISVAASAVVMTPLVYVADKTLRAVRKQTASPDASDGDPVVKP